MGTEEAEERQLGCRYYNVKEKDTSGPPWHFRTQGLGNK